MASEGPPRTCEKLHGTGHSSLPPISWCVAPPSCRRALISSEREVVFIPGGGGREGRENTQTTELLKKCGNRPQELFGETVSALKHVGKEQTDFQAIFIFKVRSGSSHLSVMGERLCWLIGNTLLALTGGNS